MAEKKPFNPTEYKNSFAKEKYDRIALQCPKGEKEALQAHAAKQGESLNAFINRAIQAQIQRDNEDHKEE